MGWLLARTLLFTLLVPGTVTVLLPLQLYNRSRAVPDALGWFRQFGWIPIAAGIMLYLWSTAEFLLRGKGTPAPWFTRPLRFLIGREPQVLVQGSIYRYTRNPMYVGVIAIVLGEALLLASPDLLWYGLSTLVVLAGC
jgi:protein-S-isoprenylcysteine O-methyltransferase Ste14